MRLLARAPVRGSCPGTLIFSGKFAEDASLSIDAADFIRVQASVDGAANVTLLEFRGNDADTYNGAFAVDTDGDGIGDGTALSLRAQTFSATIPATMRSSVVLSVTIAACRAQQCSE